MNHELKRMIDPNLYSSLLELAKDDIIIEKATQRTENVKDFINVLMSAIICISMREYRNQETVMNLLNSNPQVKEILKAKNDSAILPKATNG